MSGGVCETCHGNGSTKHRAAVSHLYFMLKSVTVTKTHVKIQQSFGDNAMSRTQDFR